MPAVISLTSCVILSKTVPWTSSMQPLSCVVQRKSPRHRRPDLSPPHDLPLMLSLSCYVHSGLLVLEKSLNQFLPPRPLYVLSWGPGTLFSEYFMMCYGSNLGHCHSWLPSATIRGCPVATCPLRTCSCCSSGMHGQCQGVRVDKKISTKVLPN